MNVPNALAVCALLAANACSCAVVVPAGQFQQTPSQRPTAQQSQVRPQSAESVHKLPRTFPIKKFYDTANLAPAKPGELIRSQDFYEYDVADGVLATRILYHSRSAGGEDVPASGVVLYPDSKPPSHGWPVIAWAHAFNGIARECAPSLARNVQHGPFLSMFVKLGYAVVAADYAGLGTNVRNAFTDAQSNATDVIYSLPAARAAVHGLDPRWVAVGVEQGGPVAIAVDELEHNLHDSSYLGSVAISALEDPEDRYQTAGAVDSSEKPLFLAYGIKTIYPDFDVKEILTDKAMALYAQLEHSCADPGTEAKVSSSELLKPNWESNKFVKLYFGRNTLGEQPAQAPLMIISSELNPDVPIGRTMEVVVRACKQGDRVEFQRFSQSTASTVFGDSVRDQIAWIQSRFAGQQAQSNCSEQH